MKDKVIVVGFFIIISL